jgi:hypothetical protein
MEVIIRNSSLLKVSFILNKFVSFHTDTMNDPTPGMHDTLSINTIVRITAKLPGIKSVAKAI